MIDRHPSVDPVHPGAILREDILPALSMSKTAMADALKISRQTLYDILDEKQPVTAEMAVRFSKLFGNGPNFWINLQRAYDLAMSPLHAELTTRQAASLLQISRTHLVRLLDEGRIPCRKVGAHRRVRVRDVLDYRRETESRRRKALDALTAADQDLGLQ